MVREGSGWHKIFVARWTCVCVKAHDESNSNYLYLKDELLASFGIIKNILRRFCCGL